LAEKMLVIQLKEDMLNTIVCKKHLPVARVKRSHDAVIADACEQYFTCVGLFAFSLEFLMQNM